jgi:hypothetical protein
VALWPWLLLVGGGALLASRRAVAGGAQLGDWTPSAAERDGWIQLQDAPGLEVRSVALAWTTPAVARVMQTAGLEAERLGGLLFVADVGPKKRGSEFPPHVSHEWGDDLDVGYTLDRYPTPADVDVDPRIVQVLAAIADWIEVVGVNEARRAAFDGAPFKVATWQGHVGHLHLRLRSGLTAEPRSLLRSRRRDAEDI